MDTFSDLPVPARWFPFSTAKLAAARNDVPRELGLLPFREGAPITRSIWVVYVSEWRIWTHAVFPVDDRLGMPDPGDIVSLCGLVADAVDGRLCGTDEEEAVVVLRRPAPPAVSEADWHIFRLVDEAVTGAKGRVPVPWSFHVATPAGAHELTHDGEIWRRGRLARRPGRAPAPQRS